ncbi:hypothetical protein AB0368_13105 [Actinoplanes sp. NPDC051475]|uniref:hypothetical protein n=1 Tax=Actinoplanes sp. NPDC051475 TaxID=3157225 RepID=UPI00344C287E
MVFDVTLELRYRRLLAVYPRDHRRAYEEEMLGVLMEGARPGQQRPSLAEVADLLWSGFLARVSRGLQGARGTGWRDAAGVTGLLAALFLAASAGRRLWPGLWAMWLGDSPYLRFGMFSDVAARTGAWLLVVAALLAGMRLTGAALAVVAVVVEIGAVASWSDQWHWVATGWVLVLASLTAMLLTVARRGRKPVAVLGLGGTLVAVGGIVLAGVVAGLAWDARSDWLMVLGYPPAAAVLLAAVGRVEAGVRRRILVLLAAIATVPVAQGRFAEVAGVQWIFTVTWDLVVVEAVFLVGLPLVAAVTVWGAFLLRDNLRVSVGKSD